MPGYSFLDENNWTSSDEEDMFDEASRIAARMRTRKESDKGVGGEEESKEDGGCITRSRRRRRGCPEPRGRRARDRLQTTQPKYIRLLHARTRSTKCHSPIDPTNNPRRCRNTHFERHLLVEHRGLQFSNRYSGKLAKKQSNSPENRPNHSA
jgi:hypothetical protein